MVTSNIGTTTRPREPDQVINGHTDVNGDDTKPTKPTNERLLCTAFVSFMGFAIAQTIAAYIAGSEALLGDSAAMAVDALTYLFNWYAERQKEAYKAKLKSNSNGKAKLEYRKYTYQLELVPPLLSVSTLLVVTVLVLTHAVRVLILDSKRDISEQGDPNVELMMLFSCLNLLLDCTNVFCFAKANHALGYETTVDEDANQEADRLNVKTMKSLLSDSEETNNFDRNNDDKNNNEGRNEAPVRPKKKMEPLEIEDSRTNHDNDQHHDESNLNMCSAYTHVFADTLRSFAVIIASVLAEFIPAVTPEEADASAAVVVSVLIALSLIPLLQGMLHTYRSLERVKLLLEEEGLETEEEIDFEDDEEEEFFVV